MGVEQTLTSSEVAALFKLHVSTVYRLVNEGILPAYKVGRGWRFNEKDIVEALSESQRKAAKHQKSPGG